MCIQIHVKGEAIITVNNEGQPVTMAPIIQENQEFDFEQAIENCESKVHKACLIALCEMNSGIKS